MIPKIIFSDFDGTLTLNGELSSVLFDVFKITKQLGSELIIVSGRSLSWGHFMLTHLPIKTCIMEGGGVILRKKGDVITQEVLVTDADLDQLNSTTAELEKKFPGFLSVDSYGRLTDKAVELYLVEDPSEKTAVEDFLAQRNAHFSSSNVHINYWYGDISKFQAIEAYLKSDCPEAFMDECMYFGDAPNDQSVFQHMKHTVGVSNISQFLHRLDYRPEVVLTGEDNQEIRGVYQFLKSL